MDYFILLIHTKLRHTRFLKILFSDLPLFLLQPYIQKQATLSLFHLQASNPKFNQTNAILHSLVVYIDLLYAFSFNLLFQLKTTCYQIVL